MKYRRLLVIMTCLLFVTVAFFCVTSAFKIKEIELNVTTVENSTENVKQLATDYLKEFEDKNLLFANLSDIEKGLEDLSGYINVQKVEKQFPNKLSVTICERKEAFAISYGEEYLIVDSALCLLEKRLSNLNNIDGNYNIVLNLSLADFNNSNLQVGAPIEIYDGVTKEYLLNATESLISLRENLKEITVTVKKDGFYSRTLTLKMVEGVVFNLENASESFSAKLNATIEFYNALQIKTSGVYYTVLEDGGNVTVKS